MSHRDSRGPQIRVNHRIRVPEVRVVLDDGSQLGVMPTSEALKAAEGRGLDLVEVNPKSVPPVCKILDFGKYKYEEKKRQSEAKRKQTIVELKEVKLRPKTDDHDLQVKVRAARRFLESGNKVKFTVRFRGREITHPQRAQMQLDWLVEQLADLANIEQRAQMEGRTMSAIVGPKPIVLQRLATDRARREAEPQGADSNLSPDAQEEIEEEEDDDEDEDDEDEDDE
ncbi:MAG TPA: translation initiation factor IF-3 [Polyangiaceae bacterium]|nr:translation initiation factor IF-3 [Polyangiaceae bacterium]